MSHAQQHYAAICLFHKNENIYLTEFVDYHLAIGFDHIYVIDNGSEISPEATLHNYIPGAVTVDYYDDEAPTGKHGRAFGYFVRKYREAAKWVAFIDTDEFIVLKQHDNIRDFLKDYETHGGVGVNALFFGDSGHQDRPDGLQIESFVQCAEESYDDNKHIKTIGHMPFVKNASRNPHWLVYREGYSCVNEKKVPFEGPHSPFSNDLIQLNHYWSRSRQEFHSKIMRGGGNGLARKMEMFHQYQKKANKSENRDILRFVPSLHETRRRWNQRPLVMALGLNKTGTTSLNAAFKRLGWSTLHDAYKFNWAVERALVEGRHPLAQLIHRYNMFSDMFYPFPNHGHPLTRIENRAEFFSLLFRSYPDIRVIVNRRDIEPWLKSREKHVKRNINNVKYRGLWREYDEAWCRMEYEAHYRELFKLVREMNVPYLEWDTEANNGYQDLCSFVGVEIPNEAFPHLAKTGKKNPASPAKEEEALDACA